jgi:HK97 family phage prohead protease
VELRDAEDATSRRIVGRPIVYDSPSSDIGFIEFIDSGALDGVDLSKVLLLRDHNVEKILARVEAGNLSLNVDKQGLYFEAELPNTTLANDTLEDIRVGNIQGMSFSFWANKDSWEITPSLDDPDVRHVIQIAEVFEITLTPWPAYTDTDVAMSSRDAQRNKYSKRDRLRDNLELAQIKLRSNT